MKLNKKGFAFSTMLYGSVALIAVVLYLILNINKESVDTTYYFSEEILANLNECVTEEIALENCYSSGSTTCNATAYHGCLGVSDNEGHTMGVLISNKLKDKVDDANSGLIEDPYLNGRYIYTGSNPQNYLNYSDKTWRIVSIETNGFLKLIDITSYGTLPWDSDGKGVWGDASSLYSMLNNNYLTSISDPSKLFQGPWTKTLIYSSGVHEGENPSTTYNINYLLEDEKSKEDLSNVVQAKAGLLYISDYMKATGNTACKSDVLASERNTDNCISWLTEYKGWTLDIDGEEGSDTAGFAYYIGSKNVSYTNPTETKTKNNVPVLEETNKSHEVYPIIYLNRNSMYLTGDGTQGNPYTLK